MKLPGFGADLDDFRADDNGFGAGRLKPGPGEEEGEADQGDGDERFLQEVLKFR